MHVHEAVRLRLKSDALVTTLVGERIFPGVLTQSVQYPAIAYRLISREHVKRLEPRGHSGLCSYRLRFFSCSDLKNGGYDSAKDVDEAMRLCLQGFRGTITDTGVSPEESVKIHGIFQRSTFDKYDDKSQAHQVISDYDVWARERQPE